MLADLWVAASECDTEEIARCEGAACASPTMTGPFEVEEGLEKFPIFKCGEVMAVGI